MDVLQNLGEEVDALLHSLSSVSINGKTYGFGEFVLSTLHLLDGLRARPARDHHVSRRAAGLARAQGTALRTLSKRSRSSCATTSAIQLIGQKDGKKYFPFIGYGLLLHPDQQPDRPRFPVPSRARARWASPWRCPPRCSSSSTPSASRSQGIWDYIKSFSPHGVPFPINLVVWVIEVFSATLRIFTLAVRLFANMYAGHIILGIFAIAHRAVRRAAHRGHHDEWPRHRCRRRRRASVARVARPA